MRLAQERREKAARDQQDLSSAMVAKAVKVTPSSYSRYENDLAKPDDDDLSRIASYFGVTRSWLRFGEGEKYAARTQIVKETESERDVTAANQPAKRVAGRHGQHSK